MPDILQSKGSTTRLYFDSESSYKTLRPAGSRYPRRLPFNSFDVRKNQPLNKSNTMRGNRNPLPPYRGNKDVGGTIVVPVDRVNIGYWFAMLMGYPTTTESSPSDIKTGSPTITITSGVATSSVAQTAWQVGDRIEYTVAGSIRYAWIKTINSTTEAVVVDQYGFDNVVDVTTASSTNIDTIKRIVYTHTYKVSPCAALESFVIDEHDCSLQIPVYQQFQGNKIGALTITTNAQGDELVANIDVLGAKYVKSSDVANSSPGTVTLSSGSATFSASHSSAAVGDMVIYGNNYTQSFITHKSSDTAMTLATTRGGSTNPTDVAGATVHAILTNADYAGGEAEEILENVFSRYEMEDAAVTEGGSTSSIMKSITQEINNELDGSNYTIGSDSERRTIPEGIVMTSGSIVGVFENDDILEKAENRTESSLQVQFTHPDTESSLTIDMNEIEWQPRSPAIGGPQGREIDIEFQGYYNDDAQESAVVVTLVNLHPSYAL